MPYAHQQPRAHPLGHLPGFVSGARTAVLLAVLACQDDPACYGRVTVREVQARAGHRSPATVKTHLDSLRRAGLVTWDEGKQGTLRAAVRVAR